MVRTGLQVILESRFDLIAGRRVGLVSQTAAVMPDLTVILDAMRNKGVRLTTLFGPEHGFSGAVADGKAVTNGIDPHTNLTVYSLYGKTLEPEPAMLAGLDILVVDFTDVGVRFYTFLSTLFYVLRAAGKSNLPVLVLDRPNPINGNQVEGPFIDPGYESFVGIVANLPVRHGMTFGELALYFNSEYHLNAPLTVVPVEGWKRSMWFDQTGLPWVSPSPAMPTLATATVYPGTCFFEGTNLSEGRGTGLPFEFIGAPWIDSYALAGRMNALQLPGVRFRPVHFQPSASKHAGQPCGGVQLHVLDRAAFQPVATGLHLLSACQALNPHEFAFLDHSWDSTHCQLDNLTGSPSIREHIGAGLPAVDLIAGWPEVQQKFAAMRKPYLLYG
jgi:uncharacterized protein YbbC (DUF1343 family)